MKTIFISEGLRMFIRKRFVLQNGFAEYSGDHEKICSSILKKCYNNEKNYFMTSTGHFSEFWTRDLGLCAEALNFLGYKKEIKNTLEYAINIFQLQGLATTINPKGKAFDFPTYAPDSLAFLLHSLKVLTDKNLVLAHKDFLQKEINNFFEIAIDKDTGLIKKKRFSSMKDHAIRESSCYDNVMAAWISGNANHLGLDNPMKSYNYKKIIKENFWTGEYFLDDLSGNNLIAGDANVFPFWTNVFTSENMLKSCIKTIRNEKLDKPFPLKYSVKKPRVAWYDIFAGNYQFRNIWPMIGYPFIEIVSRNDKKLANSYLKEYSKVIEKHKTFLEVYTPDGKPFTTTFYYADEGMLWASMHLYLSRKLNA